MLTKNIGLSFRNSKSSHYIWVLLNLFYMKTIFTTALLALAATASAQITLTQSSFRSWQPQTATAYRLDSTVAYPVLAPATNANWSLTNVTYDLSNIRDYVEGPFANSAFPSATFYDSISYPVGASLRYGAQEAGALMSNGFQFYGQKVPRQAFSLMPMTGGANDSLVFPAQTCVYSAPLTTISFPATMGSNWNSNYNFITNFNLTAQSFGLSNTPCQRKTIIAQTNNVVGWGKVSVKDSTGAASAAINVLMVKTTINQIDSFFLAGSPAPAQLLNPFGLTQGQASNRYQYNFYRAGERMPLVIASYKDNTFSATKVDYMDVHVNRLTPQGIATVNSQTGIKAYPNPVRNQSVTLQMAAQNGSVLDYVLLNMTGQTVAKGTLTPQAGTAELQAEALRTPGIYYLQLSKGGRALATLPLSVE